MTFSATFSRSSQDDNPVVFLHSSLSRGQQWSALSARFPCTSTPDLLGYGHSPMPAKARKEFRLSDELEALATELYQQPFHLVGHSFGAANALQIARHFPKQVLSLTLFEPVAFHLLDQQDPALAAITEISHTIEAFLNEGQTQQAAQYFVDYWNQTGTFERLSDKTRAQFIRGIERVAYDFHALLNEESGLQDLAHLQCPVLLMEGQHSPMTTRAVISALAQQFPNAERHDLPCGHMGPITHAEIVNPIIQQFIASHKKA
ncbi:alpha/beta fold hydrolase [Oceanospirillum beijerinckii]|uniref:alpha/beta fold hydrolase n=1 Tax=Oceanospirillum beijerinckii TaxID=64976 RepID=UPI0004251581|nr:alpha/beta hydrolase [Oceanospirillum beijerinckii]